MSTPQLAKLTALYHKHLDLNGAMADYEGWLLPRHYTSPEKEMEATQDSVGLYDISPMAKFDVKGREIDPSLRKLVKHSVPIQVGDVIEASISSHGTSRGEVSCLRLAHDHALIVGSANQRDSLSKVLEHSEVCFHAVDVTSGLAALVLIGPRSVDVLSKLTELDISPNSFSDKKCIEGGVVEIHAIVARSDLGRLLGYKIYYGWEYGEYLWDAIMEAGHEHKIAPIGFEAVRVLASR